MLVKPANALLRGFAPEHYPGNLEFGIGVYFAPKDITIYAQPDLTSQIIEKLEWRYARVQLNSATGQIEYPEDVFIAFYPYKEIALMAVIDEEDGWVKVVYNQKNNSFGWVKIDETVEKTQYNNYVGNFYTWFDFMMKIAKKRGIYFIPGVDKKSKRLRGEPKDDANIVRYDFTCVKELQIKHIRGNWLLVKAIDIGEGSPLGWVRWRDDNGQLMVFCDLD